MQNGQSPCINAPCLATCPLQRAQVSTGRQISYMKDVTLGVEFVTGRGDVARGGGRVVKNVAGFDLTRLLTGSWGSLGVVTEVTVRLRALPAVECTLAFDVGQTTRDVEDVRLALHRLPFLPFAATLLDASLARRLSVSERAATMLVRFGGNDDVLFDVPGDDEPRAKPRPGPVAPSPSSRLGREIVRLRAGRGRVGIGDGRHPGLSRPRWSRC